MSWSVCCDEMSTLHTDLRSFLAYTYTCNKVDFVCRLPMETVRSPVLAIKSGRVEPPSAFRLQTGRTSIISNTKTFFFFVAFVSTLSTDVLVTCPLPHPGSSVENVTTSLYTRLDGLGLGVWVVLHVPQLAQRLSILRRGDYGGSGSGRKLGKLWESSHFFSFLFFANGYRMYGSIVTFYMHSTDDFGNGDGRRVTCKTS